jgi:cytochrome c oxidase subunit I+III
VLFKKKRDHGNPWNAPTLEWLPQEDYGMRSIPQISARDPLWDRLTLAGEVVAGRHWLPGTQSGGRETLVTSWRDAIPQHLLVLPGDSWWPLIAAAGTAGFFLLLTVAQVALAFACGITAIVAIVVWLWQTDKSPHAATAEVADGVFLPVGARGKASHSWWAMIILLCVDATVFASLVFAHVHVSMAADVCPPPGAQLPAAVWPMVSAALLLAGSTAIVGAQMLLSRGHRAGTWLLVLLALTALVAAFCANGWGHQLADLQPSANAWSATVAAMLAYQGFHVLVLVVMGGYVCARAWAGRLRPDARASLDNTALLWHYVTVQGLAGMGSVYLMPQLG